MAQGEKKQFNLQSFFLTYLVPICLALSYITFRLRIPSSVLSEESLKLIILRSVSIIYVSGIVIFAELKKIQQILLLCSIAILSHFVGNLTFHWDEWDLLWRFSQNGFGTIFKAHGAHTIPLFLLFYLIEIFIVKLYYPVILLVSISLIVLNSFSIVRYFDALGISKNLNQKSLKIIQILFIVSSIHVESAQWAFIQCVLIQNILTLESTSFACHWLRNGKSKNLIFALLFYFLAPLVQGTGFITAFLIPFSLSFIFLSKNTKDLSLRQTAKKIFQISLYILAITLIQIIIYISLGNPKESFASSGQSNNSLNDMIDFFLFGTLGSGFLKIFSFFQELPYNTNFTDFYINLTGFKSSIFGSTPEKKLTSIAFCFLIFVITLNNLLSKDKLKSNLTIIFSLALISIFFILPTLGRHHFGLAASVHLRYQISCIVGFLLLISETLDLLLFKSKNFRLRNCVILLLCLHVFIQVKMQNSFDHFRNYTRQVSWLNCEIEKNPQKNLSLKVQQIISPDWEFTSDRYSGLMKKYGFSCH